MNNTATVQNGTEVVKYGKMLLLTGIRDMDKGFLEKITFAIAPLPNMIVSFNTKSLFRIHGSLTVAERDVLDAKLTELQTYYNIKKANPIMRKVGI